MSRLLISQEKQICRSGTTVKIKLLSRTVSCKTTIESSLGVLLEKAPSRHFQGFTTATQMHQSDKM